ncbi:MAG TPA: PspC domain-containing protein [Bacteroidales bacterium]|nr:PspC domain-containing protein [Bacteroidales bacterium]
MKKTLSVNLGGSVYHIDEDAYQELMDYLQDVKSHLGNDDSSAEVLIDIEQRISELFGQWMQGRREVITAGDVQKVIGILGRPEQFDNNETSSDAETDQSSSKSEKGSEERSNYTHRKLYRDGENARLGGVCAGIAAYLNVSVVLIRLIWVCLILFYGTGFLFYFLCWIIIPEARTAAQRLEMVGEDVTIDNIEKKVREEAGKVKDRVDGYVRSNRIHENMRNAGNGFVEFVRTILKVFFAFIAGSIGLAAFVALIGLIFALLVLWTGNLHFVQAWPNEFQPLQNALMNPSSATWMTFGLILAIGIPFIAIFKLLFGRALNMKRSAPWEIWVGFIVWFIGIGLCIFSGLHLLSFFGGFWV